MEYVKKELDLKEWFIKDNTFSKAFRDYVVSVDENKTVTIKKNDKKYQINFDTFEQVFDFVKEFIIQEKFDIVMENYFK